MRAAQEAMELSAYREADYYLRIAKQSAITREEWRVAAEAKLEVATYTGTLYKLLGLSRKVRPYLEGSGNRKALLICDYCELQNEISEGMSPLSRLESRITDLVVGAREIGAGALFARATRDLSIVLLQSGKIPELTSLIGMTTVAAPRLDDISRADLLSTTAIARTFLGDYHGATAAADECVTVALRGPDHIVSVAALTARGVVNMAGAKLKEAEADYVRALSLLRDSGLPLSHGLAINFGVLLIEQDRVADALKLFSAPELAIHRWRVVWHANVALAHYEAGNYSDAVNAAEGCIDVAKKLGAEWALIAGLSIRGLIHLDRGDSEAGLRHLEEVREMYDGAKYSVWDPTPMLRYVCRCLVACDELPSAFRLLDSEIKRVGRGNVFVRNKLLLERGRTLINSDPHAALNTLTQVDEFACCVGANLLAKHAAGLLDDVKLRL
jgi:tetratricopeptide (TPR) repeat protein